MDMPYHGFGVEPPTVEPADSDIVVRHSTVSSMDLCPLRVGLQTVPGYDPVPSPQMVFGSGLHELLAVTVKTREAYPMGELTTSALTDVLYGLKRQDGSDEDEIPPTADPDLVRGMADEMRLAYLIWVEQVWPQIEDWRWQAVEQRLLRCLGVMSDGRAVWLSGTPDAVSAEPRGFDWKTAGRKWREGRLHVETQPTAYTWLLNQGDLPWSYVVYDRSKEQWDWHESDRTMMQAEAFAYNAYVRGVQIGLGLYAASPVSRQVSKRGWWCSVRFCNAWDVCPAKNIGDSVDVAEERKDSWI